MGQASITVVMLDGALLGHAWRGVIRSRSLCWRIGSFGMALHFLIEDTP